MGLFTAAAFQTGDKAFESQSRETWIVRLGLFWDIIESVLSIRRINCVDYNQTPQAYIWIPFPLPVGSCDEKRRCSLSAVYKGGRLTESKFRRFKGDEKPWIESSFIFLFGHVCWPGGFYLNKSTTATPPLLSTLAAHRSTWTGGVCHIHTARSGAAMAVRTSGVTQWWKAQNHSEESGASPRELAGWLVCPAAASVKTLCQCFQVVWPCTVSFRARKQPALTELS